jgi:acylphosphatase
MPNDTVRIIVSGLVQGIGYRYYIYRQAVQLGLTGYVRNLPTGQVEIVASGDKGLIDEMVEAARVGPRYASVSDVQLERIEPDRTFRDFVIR